MNHFKTIIAVILATRCGLVLNSLAGIQPSFYLETLTAQASDIVVVKENEKLDGKYTVIETWKGELKSGDTMTIPELAGFSSEESRAIHRWPREARSNLLTHVTGSRMSLFLKKTASDPKKWEAASSFGGMNVW
jgi:hypothetical protein